MSFLDKIESHKHKTVKKPLKVGVDMQKMYDMMSKKRNISNIYEEDFPYNIYNLQKDAGDFFVKANIALHDVPTITLDSLEKIIYNGEEFDNSMLVKINPLDLPVEYITNSIFSGSVYKVLKLSDDVIFLGINLGRRICKITLPAYIHELTHTQVESVKGSIENYNNSEVLPIFMEKLASLEIGGKKFLQTIEDLRAYYTLSFLSSLLLDNEPKEEDITQNTMYVESFLMANNLFYTYLECDDYQKTQIIKKIQGIFDGEKALEEVLDTMNINVQNSSNPKVLEKSLYK